MRYGPTAAPASARVPQAISATSRSFGCAALPLRPGRANAARFSPVAGALIVVPSHATASSPHTCDHGAAAGVSAEHSRPNSSSSGFSPTRRRARVSAVVAGTCQPAAASARERPLASDRTTSPYGKSLNRHSPSTNNTTSRPGSARCRPAGRPAPASTSSTSPAGTTRDSTPTPTPDRAFPRVDDHHPQVAPWTANEAPAAERMIVVIDRPSGSFVTSQRHAGHRHASHNS